jgi:uncharacterized membrane protein
VSATSTDSGACDRERGAVIAIVALSLGFLLAATALTVDLGRQWIRRRDMQNVADALSLDLVRRVDGRTEAEILSDPSPIGFTSTIATSRAQNDFAPSATRTLTVELGSVVNETFIPDPSPSSIPTAVKVTASDDIAYFFMPGKGHVSRSAVTQASSGPGGSPSSAARACFELGSYALGLNSANAALLNFLIGGALHTGVLSYNGIATSQVTLGDLAAELGFGTPEQLLTSNVDFDTLVTATADVLQRNGDVAGSTFLLSIPPQTPGSPSIDMSQVVSVQNGGQDPALAMPLNVLDLIAGSAFVANGTNALAVPALAINVPGVTVVNASATIVQKPVPTCGSVGAHSDNRQVTLHINAAIPNATVDLNVALASGVGTINGVECGATGGPKSLTIGVRSDLMTVSGSVKSVIPSSTLGLVAPTGQAENSSVTFTVPPPLQQTASTGSGAIGLQGTTLTGNPLVVSVLQPNFDAFALALDIALVQPMADLFGINVGGADVTAIDIQCSPPQITQ